MGLKHLESDSSLHTQPDDQANRAAIVRSFLDAEHERESMHDEVWKRARRLLHGKTALEIPGDELEGHPDQANLRYVRLERAWEGEAGKSQFTGYNVILARKDGENLLLPQTFHLGFFSWREDTFTQERVGEENAQLYPLNQDHYNQLGITLKITLEALGRRGNALDAEGASSTITLINFSSNSPTGDLPI